MSMQRSIMQSMGLSEWAVLLCAVPAWDHSDSGMIISLNEGV